MTKIPIPGPILGIFTIIKKIKIIETTQIKNKHKEGDMPYQEVRSFPKLSINIQGNTAVPVCLSPSFSSISMLIEGQGLARPGKC